ncbi:short subunit dehydrogenase [Kineothrix alysoides]|uniref:Short subunit dehydrogenase n=1 Tax=Kineothrix alysoides TaxID=1469948 RepID=A0A4R1R539_9FIRM|nr:SDR family NAD(P)-dependent oxidoreductase [Kineothrix alysoides]TCL60625.1 short subunit dehydrogenase [Kineothrix alysoides]
MLPRRTCVIVGGAKGEGSLLAEKYAGQGYLIAFMDIDKEAGRSLKEKIEHGYGGKVFFFHGDANSEEDLELFAGAVIGQYKKIDCLYYRRDIAEGADQIEELVGHNLKKGGTIEAYR